MSVAGTPATLVEAVGEKNGSISVYHPVGNQTWFYKITGPSAVVTAEKARSWSSSNPSGSLNRKSQCRCLSRLSNSGARCD
ncbi:MAG: hypothetical protein CM1200mP29_02600 [Verrucomicrobiota bacterium]|nr:MAG: hypothetical protein CM1200mP29_02600 [Verrucomicrobiota bacterium]